VPGSSSAPAGWRETWRKLWTYTAGSVVAAGCSELVLVVCYAVLHWPAAVSAVVAWFGGAVPNYLLNRRWTWRRTGRPDVRREVVPYVAIILVTLALAAAATRAVDIALADSGSATRTTLVAATFLGVYVLMFLLRYLLLDRLFGRLGEPVVDEVDAR
jgi:putative flippase GtrA